MSTIVLKLGRLFENVVELTNALKFRYSDLLTIGEPDFVSDYIYLACTEEKNDVAIYFACKAIAKMYNIDLNSEVYCTDIPGDNSWIVNIMLGNPKKAITYLEEQAKTDQYAYRYLKWLSEDCHDKQYEGIFVNNKTNIPVECLELKDNIDQYLAMALMDDPIAIYRLAELVDSEAIPRFNTCTLFAKNLKRRAEEMSQKLTPMAMWDVQRAKWNGYKMKTINKHFEYTSFKDFPGIEHILEAGKHGYPPAMYEYMRLTCDIASNLSLKAFHYNETYEADMSEFEIAYDFFNKLKKANYMTKGYKFEERRISDTLKFISSNNYYIEKYIANGYRTDEEVKEDRKKELNEYIDKLNEKEKWRNLSDYGYSVTDSTLKEAAENAGLHETAFEFQQRVEFRNELINEKIKKIKEED